jgi:hypothetical protein
MSRLCVQAWQVLKRKEGSCRPAVERLALVARRPSTLLEQHRAEPQRLAHPLRVRRRAVTDEPLGQVPPLRGIDVLGSEETRNRLLGSPHRSRGSGRNDRRLPTRQEGGQRRGEPNLAAWDVATSPRSSSAEPCVNSGRRKH